MGTNSFGKSEDFSGEDQEALSSEAQPTLNPSLQSSHQPYDQKDTSGPLNFHY